MVFALTIFFAPPRLQDRVDRLVGGLGGRRPVHNDPVGLQPGFHSRQVGVEIFHDMLLDLPGDLAESVRIGVVIEQYGRALFVTRLGTAVHGLPGVGPQVGGELVDLLEFHRWTREC
jgi:hypothetical protein